MQARNKNRRRRSGGADSGPFSVESDLQSRGFHHIIGSDESGRGCLAGPVITASVCILTDDFSKLSPIPNVGDSKTLTEQERRDIYQQVIDQSDVYAYQVAQRSNEDIDEMNILRSTMECFAESIETLVDAHNFPTNKTYSIVDGKKTPKLSNGVSCRPWVKGDSVVYTVALASIIAKVTRDKIMTEDVHTLYPEYGFDSHYGYSTPDHIEAIHKHGASPVHRMSCKPVKGR